MKINLNFSLLSFFLGATTYLSAQQSVQKTPDNKYVGKCEVVATNMKSCKKCDDEKLTKNCKNVICDDYGQCAELHIKNTSLTNIRAASSETKIKGILKEKTPDGQTQYFLQEGNYRMYISRNKDGYDILEYDLSKADKNVIMAKPLTPAQISCIQGCKNVQNNCINASNHNEEAIAICKKEGESCARDICLKFVKKYTIYLPASSMSNAKLKIY